MYVRHQNDCHAYFFFFPYITLFINKLKPNDDYESKSLQLWHGANYVFYVAKQTLVIA